MAENAFLTDRRREFLEGDYDLDTSADRHLKRRLENSANLALSELIEVAESPYIDNTEVFDPETVNRLITALLIPDLNQYEGGGLVGPNVDPDDPATVDLSEEFQHYRDRLYVVLDEPMHVYRDNRFPDPSD